MSPTARRRLDTLQGWLVALPALALAWAGPGALLADVPTASSAGAGWLVLLALPAAALAVVLAALGAGGRASASPLLLVVLFVAVARSEFAGDGFEARRALCVLSAALVLLLAGAGLGPRGRRALARGLGVAALAAVLGAWFDGRPGLGGPVGNTGHLAEFALPGAVLGLGLLIGPARPFRVVGLGTALALALFAGIAPALTTLVALGATVVAALVLGRAGAARRWARPALVVLGVGVATFALASRAVPTAPGAESGAETAPGDLGGVEFRRRTWARLPGLLADFPLFGVGPGQFEREFPPYRDREELVASSLDRREPTPIEVEHAHNDWLQGVVEHGIVGGSAWLALLLVALVRAGAALRSEDELRAAFGAAGLAVLVAALANSTLLASPAAPAAAWPVLGVVLARPRSRGETLPRGVRRATLLVAVFAFLLLGIRRQHAQEFVAHGRALARLADARVVEVGGNTLQVAEDVVGPLADALAATPDSVVALEKRSRFLAETGAPPDQRIATLERLLELRPHRLAALINLGATLADAGRLADAETPFEHALELDPTNPSLLRSHARLAAERGDGAALVPRLADARSAGALEPAWLEFRAADLLLAGRPGLAQLFVWELEPDRTVTDANACYAWGKELEASGRRVRLADGALACAHLFFARGHVADGVPESAIRSYRQALRLADRYTLPDGAAGVRLELAAAQALGGRAAEARATLDEATPAPHHWAQLPEWAGQALLEAELLGVTGDEADD